MKLRVTEIQIVPVKPQNGLVGFASFILNDCFYLGCIGIITRPEGGFRLTYPERKSGLKSFNIYHPINREACQLVETAVVDKFLEVTKGVFGN